MKMKAKIQKWGNGLGLRVSGPIRDIPHFTVNTELEIDINAQGFTAKKINKKLKFKLPFSEKELLDGMTPQKAHADIVAKPLSSEF